MKSQKAIKQNYPHPAEGPRHCERSEAIHITSPCSQGEDRRGSTMLTPHPSQSGRSMVEMLGTLAIVGVLSAGAIGGYSYAMNKHRTNELIYEATKRAQWVGTQLEMNNLNPSINTFGTNSFGGGTFNGIDTTLPNTNQFGIIVSNLNEAVCQNIISGLETERNGVIRTVLDRNTKQAFNIDNCDNNPEFLLVFNRDLGTNDTESFASKDPEVSGEASASAGAMTEAATQNPDDVHCNGNGSWDGSSCYCDPDWDGDSCSEHKDDSPSTDPSYEPEETATATVQNNDPCHGHGDWNSYYQRCYCYTGWDGNDCSEKVCNGHGYIYESACYCQHGWGGENCSQENSCSNHGYGVVSACGSFCVCDSGYGGSDCSMSARAACAGNGIWHAGSSEPNGGYCECDDDYWGNDCSICPNGVCAENPCNGHGGWSKYGEFCVCDDGYGGSDCSMSARAACAEHGVWHSGTRYAGYADDGYCECDPGYTGADCSTPQ